MPHSINILLPIKHPSAAKERLASLLSIEQRQELAQALIEQTFSFFANFRDLADILVVTDSADVSAWAEARGFAVLMEEQAEGETKAVERGTAWSVAHGYAVQVVIPGDMVALDPQELRELLQRDHASPGVILCPATGDDGTNAVLTAPPDVIRFRFGDRSFPDYQERAQQAGVPCEIVRLQSLVLDLDTPEDVAAAMQQHPHSPICRKLASWGISIP